VNAIGVASGSAIDCAIVIREQRVENLGRSGKYDRLFSG
jgi:UDP-3-O-acyl-N-acetylglucosamine deacetylase